VRKQDILCDKTAVFRDMIKGTLRKAIEISDFNIITAIYFTFFVFW